MTDTGENTRNYYRNQGAEAERERIIKLLEHMPRTDDDRTVDAPTLIALIKGKK